MSIKQLVVLCIVLLAVGVGVSSAKREYFSSDGMKVARADIQKQTSNRAETTREKLRRAGAAAAAAGYKAGQTVTEKNGIIYKLAIDPETNGYTLKRYRRVKAKAGSEAKKPGKKVAAPAKAKKVKKVRKRKTAETAAIQNTGVKATEKKVLGKEARVEAEKKRRLATKMAPGRNLEPGQWGIRAEHRFLKRKTVLESRTITTASGTVSDSAGVGEDGLFYTDAHADLLVVGYGLTQRLELFLQAGILYETLSDITDFELGYGAGFRVSLVTWALNPQSSVYLDATGRYLTGKIKGSFSDTLGETYDKSSDIDELDIGFEAGVTWRSMTLYSGLSYGVYTEKTVKSQAASATDFTILRDDMEAQENLLFRLGGAYAVIPELNVYLEGHAFYGEGILAGAEYRF